MLSVLVVVSCAYYLQKELFGKADETDFSTLTHQLRNGWLLLLPVVLLMPLNWAIETVKWKLILNTVEKLTFSFALRSVISGITLGIVTPNGIGDYGGRILSLKSETRSTALFLNGFLSLSQLLVTVICGLIGYSIIQHSFPFQVPKPILFGLGAVLLFGFLTKKFKFRFLSSFIKSRGLQIRINLKNRVIVLLFSILRYFVFSLQYVLLLQLCGVELSLSDYFGIISTIFLVVAIVPTGWFSNLLVRGSVSYYFFDQISSFGELAVVASSALWIINLFVPAIIGLFFIGKVDWMQLIKFKRI